MPSRNIVNICGAAAMPNGAVRLSVSVPIDPFLEAATGGVFLFIDFHQTLTAATLGLCKGVDHFQNIGQLLDLLLTVAVQGG